MNRLNDQPIVKNGGIVGNKNLCIATLIIGAAAFLAYGASIYVSPSGKDSNDGSIGSPLATLAAARDKADQLKAGATPVTIYLREGTYYLSEPLLLGPSNSGSAGTPIVYSGYQNEKAVVSGGIKVTAQWETSGQAKVATIAKDLKVDQLFLNGKRQILARYPNYDPSKILDGYNANWPSHESNWANPGEGPGYLRGLHNGSWGGNSYFINGKGSSARKWVGDNNRGSGLHSQCQMVENIYEELDASGEWFYRKSTGQLFFNPPAGTDLATAKIELASLDELIRIIGTDSLGTDPAKVAKHITFRKLTFTHAFRTLFSKPYEPMLRGDWRIARAGAIFMENAEHIRIEHCFFDQIGGNGVFFSGYNRHHVVFNNNFQEAGASCVVLFGRNSSNWCPSKNFEDGGPCDNFTDAGPKMKTYPAHILIDNNMMHNLGRFEKQTAGVCLSMAQFDTVRHNTIYKMPRAGINFTDGCYGGHVIEYNWVYESVLETGDHGPFNAWGRDRICRKQDDLKVSKLDAQYPTIVRNNRFEVKAPHFGIDLDDQATNYYQEFNLCIGGGLKLQWNRFNTYLNNILVNGAVVDIHSTWNQTNHYVARNIFSGASAYALLGMSPSDVKSRITQIDSNVIWNNGNTPNICGWPGHNGSVTSWSSWKGAGLDAHSKTEDPMFIDPSKGDYRVKAGSPALALGFKNFPMDSFGVRKVDTLTAINPSFGGGNEGIKEFPRMLRCRSGRLIVSAEGGYKVTIVTASGRTVWVSKGKDGSNVVINPDIGGAGVYFASVQTNDRVEMLRFLVH